MTKKSFKSGFVALIGAPNAGKSTLLNNILGQKISITSRRPQTTRHRILGIKTTEASQVVYVDTPGMHLGGKRALNKYLNKTADTSLMGVDVIVWVKDDMQWDAIDISILEKLKNEGAPVVLAINKIDKVADKESLLPFIQKISLEHDFQSIIPISALTGKQLGEFEQLLLTLLPEGELMFPEDQVTDSSERFMATEIIREKLIRRLGQEIPHSLSISIDQYKVEEKITRIHAVIWVERDGQKNIVIGDKGVGLKEVGTQARLDIEKMLESKVYLNLWVKVKKNWSDNERELISLGYRGIE
ncbi:MULTISPECIES: GTPase Era [Cycloclasticus]|jgi:GTP-binding protein Era|uniref:GTPase Era n=1 Tax=Cycloclasticus pugetii TaxID=34068 RepID=A0AB33Z0L9_9GAMM|nr:MULTISPECIES: GTPase Era [Cycloclasticus]AFT67115.1 GTP-binding protein [Cycloclasticus sp. P1]ATI03283.1 GTPase Era [Cycloclasticus sp. PY97N]EPD12728.1 GTP-binding protein [Cycloclasticus pugetii]MBV1899985.1 GTPase Era [Cycloclasticus sp.]MDF1828928.1 GTPase Era [Cycloclasticus pugetii]|tara:strand:+ start:2006 stop:2908 length:903 start_codon:yes stop_codon:yes gene_type:complete